MQPNVCSAFPMSYRVKICILGLIVTFGAISCLGQDVHILLRPRDGKTSFHLGESISVEAACVASGTQQYLVPCAPVLRADGTSAGSRLTVDRIDQMTWLDAQSGSLPPGPRGVCGTIVNQLPSQQSQAPAWQVVTLGNHFQRMPDSTKSAQFWRLIWKSRSDLAT